MKKEGLDPTKVDVSSVGKVEKVATKMAIGTVAIIAGAGVVIFAGACMYAACIYLVCSPHNAVNYHPQLEPTSCNSSPLVVVLGAVPKSAWALRRNCVADPY